MKKIFAEKAKERTISFHGDKITVKSIIGLMEQSALNSVVLNFYNSNENGAELPLCKGLFDVCVLAFQTGIEIEGIKIVNDENGGYTINTNLGYFELQDFIDSGLCEKVNAEIDNYNGVWNNILQGIIMANLRKVIGTIGSNLPSAEEMKESLNEFKNIINENPQFIDKAIKAELVSDAIVAQPEKEIGAKRLKRKRNSQGVVAYGDN